MAGIFSWPGGRDWIFSAKVFAAAMLALYIGLAAGLPRPYWAMATVYLVSHPLAGATRSKGAYRVVGTLLGAVAAVALVPTLVNWPPLLMGAMACWVGLLLYLSLMERSPRSYVFLLAAYTLPIVALPAVNDPTQVFDLAVARVEEICIGIVSASVVGSVVLPARVATAMQAQTGVWLADAARWATAMLCPVPGRAAGAARDDSRYRLAADIRALDTLITHLAYDADTALAVRCARALHARMTLLLPELALLDGVAQALRRHPDGVPPTLAARMAEVATWIGDDSVPMPAPAWWEQPMEWETMEWETMGAQPMGGESASATPMLSGPVPSAGTWHAGLVAAARQHLDTLVDLWHDCLALQQRMGAASSEGRRGRSASGQPESGMPVLRYADTGLDDARYHDHAMLLVYALTAGGATFVAGLLWMASGWIDGAGPTALAALTACIYATTDEPRRTAWRFVRWSLVCLLVSWFYVFVVLPYAHDFTSLAGLLSVPYLVIGALIARPGFNLFAILLSVNAASFANVQALYDTNFGNLFNATLATFAAMAFAPLWVVTVRPFGARAVSRRLVHASWRDIATGARPDALAAHPQLRGRMLDRLLRLVPLLAGQRDRASQDGFAELQIGFGTLLLQRDLETMPARSRRVLIRMLRTLECHYRRRAQAGQALPPSPALAVRIDCAIATVGCEARSEGRRTAPIALNAPTALNALSALTAIRLTLYPDAPAQPM